MGRPHFLLRLLPEPELRPLYQRAADKHNDVVVAFLSENRGHPDAGFDLYLPGDITFPAREPSNKVFCGVRCAMFRVGPDDVGGRWSPENATPVGYYLRARSSTGSKTGLRLANSVGVIDAGYRGELCAVFDNVSETSTHKAGDRLVQVCAPDISFPVLVDVVDSEEELGFTVRGERGFGSSGR